MTERGAPLVGIDTDETEKAIVAAAAIAPDLPVALAALRCWWGCEFCLERIERTNRVNPRDMWTDKRTVGEVFADKQRLDALASRWIEDGAALLVRHHAAGHRFDAEAAGRLLDTLYSLNADREARGLPPIALPAALVKLIAEHLQGRLANPQGRRVRFNGWPDGWIIRRAAAREFADRRAAGEKHDALVAEFADVLGMSRSTVESIVSPKK